jgi:hypothetical protein
VGRLGIAVSLPDSIFALTGHQISIVPATLQTDLPKEHILYKIGQANHNDPV